MKSKARDSANKVINTLTSVVPVGNEIPPEGKISTSTARQFLIKDALEQRVQNGLRSAQEKIGPEIGLEDIKTTYTRPGFGTQEIVSRFVKPRLEEGCTFLFWGNNFDLYRNKVTQAQWDIQGNKEQLLQKNKSIFEDVMKTNFRIDAGPDANWDDILKKTLLVEISRKSVPGSIKIGPVVLKQSYEPQIQVFDPIQGVATAPAMTVSEFVEYYHIESEATNNQQTRLVKVLERIMADKDSKEKPYRVIMYREDDAYGRNARNLGTKHGLKIDTVLPIVDVKPIQEINKDFKDPSAAAKIAKLATIAGLSAFMAYRAFLSYTPGKINASFMTENGGKPVQLSKDPVKHGYMIQANDRKYYLPLAFGIEIDGNALEGNYGTMYPVTGQNPQIKFSIQNEVTTKLYLTTKKEKQKKRK